MSVREWLNQRPAVVYGGCAVLLLLGGYVAYSNLFAGESPDARLGYAFFVDSETGEVFRASRHDHIPPFERDGRTCYRAHVYTFGECEEGEWFVGLYEKYPDEAFTHMEANNLEFPLIEPVVSADMETWHHKVLGDDEAIWAALRAKEKEHGSQATKCEP